MLVRRYPFGLSPTLLKRMTIADGESVESKILKYRSIKFRSKTLKFKDFLKVSVESKTLKLSRL